MPWISKKAKAQMRARRKKCKDKPERNENSPSGQDNDDQTNNTTNVIHNSKTMDEDSTIDIIIASSLSSKEAKKMRKDARRKVRKEQKDENLIRFVDEQGNVLSKENEKDPFENVVDESDSVSNHVSSHKRKSGPTTGENNANPTKKKPKTSFPNINQILAQAEEIKQQKEEEEKRKSYQDSIPDDIKNQYLALDCEMVGIGAEGKQSALARVSITNWNGDIILDTFVQVPDRVTDFRTFVSGIRAKDIKMTNDNAMELHACRQKVGEIIQNKILIGHSLRNDFQALMMNHPRHLIRDTARYKPFMRASGRSGGKLRPRKLRDLVKENVGLVIQKDGEAHSSVDDAKATMELFKAVREEWEKELEKAESKNKSSLGKKRKKR